MNQDVDKIFDVLFGYQDELCSLLDKKEHWDHMNKRERIFVQIDTVDEILHRIRTELNITEI